MLVEGNFRYKHIIKGNQQETGNDDRDKLTHNQTNWYRCTEIHSENQTLPATVPIQMLH